mmetsp:Transcript_14908/g.30659  ORF Transcript_14908/g.30659 Transcript_14908/m.30659 type:complete len:219 (-) Transcript_14908:1893-2549(-)
MLVCKLLLQALRLDVGLACSFLFTLYSCIAQPDSSASDDRLYLDCGPLPPRDFVPETKQLHNHAILRPLMQPPPLNHFNFANTKAHCKDPKPVGKPPEPALDLCRCTLHLKIRSYHAPWGRVTLGHFFVPLRSAVMRRNEPCLVAAHCALNYCCTVLSEPVLGHLAHTLVNHLLSLPCPLDGLGRRYRSEKVQVLLAGVVSSSQSLNCGRLRYSIQAL